MYAKHKPARCYLTLAARFSALELSYLDMIVRSLILALLLSPGVSVSDNLVNPPQKTGSFALNQKLLNLQANTWVKLHVAPKSNWHRQSHAGIAYDSKRGTLLIFGSNTHGMDWDNEVHEFDPRSESWATHYPRAPKETYRADAAGNAIAGNDKLLPWAMHTYDNILYDPKLDALVVMARADHNPVMKAVPEAHTHPTWIYDLKVHEWRVFPNNGKPYPNFFASASAFDSGRSVIVGYRSGIWEIGRERDEWRRGTKERHHEIHFLMDYDTKHKKLAVFGNHGNANDVWVYTPGPVAGFKGQWEHKIPTGDPCPRSQSFPVAFDIWNAVFLLVPSNTPSTIDARGRERFGRPKSNSTFIYDLEKNQYRRLPRGEMDYLGMNYMMAYDQFHKVFLLVTGNHARPTTVWALRLDLTDLDLNRP